MGIRAHGEQTEGREGEGVRPRSTNNNIHYTLHSPPSPAARLKLFGRFCILRSCPSPRPSFPASATPLPAAPPNSICLHLRPSGGRRRGGGVPHHVRVTRESAKGRGRDLAARLRPMRVVRGPLPIHVSKQASNLPCLNQGSPRAAAASLTSFGPRGASWIWSQL